MAEQKFEKDVDYNTNRDDFMGEDEILVTITLGEYRSLLKENAVASHEKNRLINEKVHLESERKALEEQNHELLKEVRSLQGVVAEAEEAEQEETNGAEY